MHLTLASPTPEINPRAGFKCSKSIKNAWRSLRDLLSKIIDMPLKITIEIKIKMQPSLQAAVEKHAMQSFGFFRFLEF